MSLGGHPLPASAETGWPGHDLRFAVDSSKLRALGWEPAHDLDTRLGDTIEWYRARQDWWRPLRKAIR